MSDFDDVYNEEEPVEQELPANCVTVRSPAGVIGAHPTEGPITVQNVFNAIGFFYQSGQLILINGMPGAPEDIVGPGASVMVISPSAKGG